jgi:hypothetical protein
MLPLLIVPLIAVFGIPQFTPISAQTADGADGDEPQLHFEPGEDAPLAEAVPPFPGGSVEPSPPSSSSVTTERWTDPFENPTEWMAPDTPDENSRTTPTSSPPGSRLSDPFNQPEAPVSPAPPADLWAQPQPEHPRAGAGIKGYSRHPNPGQNPGSTPAAGVGLADQLTWREAVARLNKLGVQKFQLSQTEEPYVFQFVCDLSRPDNPRVTHRFEAKAGEPLKAVENVIQQVESWSAQQAPR